MLERKWVKKELLKIIYRSPGGTAVDKGLGYFPFEMKWRESISWSRLNIIDLTVYRLPHHLKF